MTDDLLNVADECQIVATRTLGFPRTQVFRAWTDPAILKEWWGPAGFTNTFHEHDLRPGGTWKFTMHGPEKGHYENECVFMVIKEPEMIAWDRRSKPLFRVVTTFEEVAPDATKVVFRMQFATKEECDKIRNFVPDKNEENFDKLDAVLQQMN